MKVKKFKNLWLMGIILSAVFILTIYILKSCCPEFVVEVAQIESICRIGHYIDNNKWAWYTATFFISYLVYFLICCACAGRNGLTWKEHLIIAITIGILFLIKEFIPGLYTAANVSSLVLLPCIMRAKTKNLAIVFTSMNFLQFLTLEIRGLKLMIIDYNFATFLILIIDVYIFEFLLYFKFYYDTLKED